MFKILQDRYYGLDSKQKLYNAAKGEKILLDGQFIILLFTVGCSMPFYVKIFYFCKYLVRKRLILYEFLYRSLIPYL